MTSRQAGRRMATVAAERHGSRSRARRKTAPPKKQETPAAARERRQLIQLVVCGTVFVLLVAAKLLLPDRMARINEAISRAMDPILDEKDPIAGSYHFEVCSAGLERVLKRPADFERFLGSAVAVKLYRPRNGLKEIPAILRGYDSGRVTVEAGKETITFEKSEVALVRLRVEF